MVLFSNISFPTKPKKKQVLIRQKKTSVFLKILLSLLIDAAVLAVACFPDYFPEDGSGLHPPVS